MSKRASVNRLKATPVRLALALATIYSLSAQAALAESSDKYNDIYNSFDSQLFSDMQTNHGQTNNALVKPLIHPVLQTKEFAFLDKELSTSQLRESIDDPGCESRVQRCHIAATGCFYGAEVQAAYQFSEKLNNLTDFEILQLVGEPQVKTGPVIVWNDNDPEIANWIYYLGYSNIAIRVQIKGHRCVASHLLSREMGTDFIDWNIKRFSSGRFDGDTENISTTIAGHEIRRENPEGKSVSEIEALFGPPNSTKNDSAGRIVYIYNTSSKSRVEIPFENGKAYGRIGHGVNIGFKLRAASTTKN